MSPRTGRPKSEHPRVNVIPVRFSDDEIAKLRAAADKATAKTLAEYIRNKALGNRARR